MPRRPSLTRYDFNPRSSCEERLMRRHNLISSTYNFNPRSSCEERRSSLTICITSIPFQSTLLMRGATRASLPPHLQLRDFNPRSSCEERLFHADNDVIPARISIHAPHARSDPTSRGRCTWRPNFNPRSSCEERRGDEYALVDGGSFQSTLLMRGATSFHSSQTNLSLAFQSTLLMRGATVGKAVTDIAQCRFQSTLLMRGATFYPNEFSIFLGEFQSTLLMRGATIALIIDMIEACRFQSTLLMRGATGVTRHA